MSWKIKIKQQLDEAKRLRAINNSLYKLAKDCLEGDTEFNLVYLSGREQYIWINFRVKLGKETTKILLSKYGKTLWKKLKK